MAQWWRDVGLIPGSGRYPAVGTGNLLQYSCLEIPMDRGAWWATVDRVINSWTWLSNTHNFWTSSLLSLTQEVVPWGGLSGRPLSYPWDSLTTYWCLCWFQQDTAEVPQILPLPLALLVLKARPQLLTDPLLVHAFFSTHTFTAAPISHDFGCMSVSASWGHIPAMHNIFFPLAKWPCPPSSLWCRSFFFLDNSFLDHFFDHPTQESASLLTNNLSVCILDWFNLYLLF